MGLSGKGKVEQRHKEEEEEEEEAKKKVRRQEGKRERCNIKLLQTQQCF